MWYNLLNSCKINTSSKKLILSWADNTNSWQYAIFDYQIINFNVLYNITVILHSGHVYWYLDDQLVETDDITFTTLGAQSTSVPDLNIGRCNRLYDTYLNGYKDELESQNLFSNIKL